MLLWHVLYLVGKVFLWTTQISISSFHHAQTVESVLACMKHCHFFQAKIEVVTFFHPTLVHSVTMLINDLVQALTSDIALPNGPLQEQSWSHLNVFMKFCGQLSVTEQFFVEPWTFFHILYFEYIWQGIIFVINILYISK